MTERPSLTDGVAAGGGGVVGGVGGGAGVGERLEALSFLITLPLVWLTA